MFAIPEHFIQAMIEVHGDAGRTWLEQLPEILTACADQWGIVIDPPFPHLSYNYVAPAACSDGTPAIIKACPPEGEAGEFMAQALALEVYAGRGAARVLALDPARSVLLLERLEPGTLLSTVEDDEEATSICCGVMRELWRPAVADLPLPSVADWGQGFERLRRHYAGGSGPFQPALLDQAERLFAELTASSAAPVVLHGDLHQYNILAAGGRGWLAIDPKGVLGEPAYEIGAFLRNCLPKPLPNAEAAQRTARRIDQFTAELQLDRARVRGWALSQAILSAWWSVEDHGHGWEPMAALAEMVAQLRE
jgi:streptomycin 6-kinase